MALRIYNTLTKKKEEFVPLEEGKVKFYLCGPTVYDYFHIGNARPFIIFDVFRRFLRYRGYEVKFVVNITDIDDKIINKSKQEGLSTKTVAEKYTAAYFEDSKKLGIEKADVHPKATDHIEEMIRLIQKLVDKGFAYAVDGDIYFDVSKFVDYGKLSGKNLEELKAGARVEVDRRKRNPLDFALWKQAKQGEPCWESPWGKGRPGWHIECSTMSMKYLGETFDIHAGGTDLIFPHHENEIAQSEGATGKPFARYWMHIGFLNVNGKKMSKSLGNFFTAREVLEKHKSGVIRLFFLQKHYRSLINFSQEILRKTEEAWDKLINTIDNIELVLEGFEEQQQDIGEKSLSAEEREFDNLISATREEFINALEDDFNTAMAIAKIFALVRETNKVLAKDTITKNEKKLLLKVKQQIEEFDQFLGLLDRDEEEEKVEVKKLIDLLIEIRSMMRKQRNWEIADKIRTDLKQLGIILEDRKEGTVWKRVKE